MPLERPVTPSLLAAIALAAAPVAAGAQPRAAAAPLSDLASLDVRLGELSRRVAPSVVQVLASGYTTAPNALLARAGASGSGVIVDAEGWIVTNAHVVESARSVRVDLVQPAPAGGSILRPRSRRLPARVVGLDRETDVAVLKIEQSGLPALEIGDSEALHRGRRRSPRRSPPASASSSTAGSCSPTSCRRARRPRPVFGRATW